jgi:pilus assembly protein Flp/PilA
MMSIASISAPNRACALRLINEFRNDESGATAIEYGLIVALIFLAIIGAVKNFGATTNEMYTGIETEINSVIE